MRIKYDLTEMELEDIAKKQGKTINEVASEYKYALKDLEYSLKEINSIIQENNFKTNFDNINIKGYGKFGELKNKYICYNNIEKVNSYDLNDIAIVTGFGPTNAPTAGTLSTIFKTLELQKETGIYTHIVISELSALNSRQKSLDSLSLYSKQFITFIKKLGFDENNGEIRTDNFLDHSRTFSIISSVFKTSDFMKGEATDKMYKRLNILGNDFSTMVSQCYTVADIVLPLIRDRKKCVIVPAGLEEFLYPQLAQVSIDRMKNKVGGINNLINPEATVCALYGKIIKGLFPYVKMSKSIKDSSINLGDTNEKIYEKIVECGSRNEEVILQMITLASNWDANIINNATIAFNNRNKNYDEWLKYKKKYYDFFIKLKHLWEESKYNEPINTYNELFKVGEIK